MGILNKATQYDLLIKNLTALKPGDEETLIIENRAYVVKPAEVDDIERVPVGRVFVVGD